MSKKVWIFIPMVMLLLGWGALSGLSQEPFKFKLLVVDETKTFASSIRVELLARAIKRTGLFELSAKIVDVGSSFANPLQGEKPDKRYEIIIIVPRGIDDGTVRQVWISTRPFTEISEELRSAVTVIKEIANGISQGMAKAVDVTEDLIPGYFATLFIKEGWL